MPLRRLESFFVILQEAKNYFKEKFNAPPTFAVCTRGKMGRLLSEQEHSDGFVFPMVSKNVLDESTKNAVYTQLVLPVAFILCSFDVRLRNHP